MVRRLTPDGRTLATGSSYNTVRLWDVATAHEIGVLDGQSGKVFAGGESRRLQPRRSHARHGVRRQPGSGRPATTVALQPDAARPRLTRVGLPFLKRDQQRFDTAKQWCPAAVAQ